MTLIEYFGLVIKPKITKGRYMLAPIPNGEFMPGIYALRDKDVNAFIYEKDGHRIAIDCGYKNSSAITNAMHSLGLNGNSVSALFLTHLDLDHAGGADRRCNCVFPNAQIYLGRIEEGYLTTATAFTLHIIPIGYLNRSKSHLNTYFGILLC